MTKPTFDPGLTQRYTGSIRRIIDKDGGFNVRRRGTTRHDIHPYLYMINTTWPRFLLDVLAGYLVLNLIFATIYWKIGVEHLRGAEAPTEAGRFLNAFFFSAHTLTTVGYGSISPGDRSPFRAILTTGSTPGLQREDVGGAVPGSDESAISSSEPAFE